MVKVKKTMVVGDNNYHYTPAYFTDNKWIDSDTIVIARSINSTIGYHNKTVKFESEEDDRKNVELIKYSFKDGSMEVLVKGVNSGSYIVSGRKVYYTYGKKLNVVDVDSREVKTLYISDVDADNPDKCIGGLAVTNDGKTISVYTSDENKETVILVIDTENGKVKHELKTKFAEPFYQITHCMICPTNEDLMYFCHEGTTEYISNRMWLWDMKENKKWNFAKQRIDADGNVGDCFGHEMWTPDGKGMYFVKYPQSPILPTGLCYTDIQTGKVEAMFTGYKYWHVGVSRDGKYLAADTMLGCYNGTNECEIIVADLEDKTENVVAIAHSSGSHPCHPHPQLSPDNSKIVYTTLDENGRTVMGVAFLE